MLNYKYRNKNYYESITDLSIAIELDPEYQWAYAFRGNTKNDLMDFKGAIKDISFALKNKNLDCFLFYERGKLFFKIKNYEKAINDLSEFISKSKDKSNLHRYYVESLFLKICCLKILNLHYWDEIQSLSDIKNQYSYGSYRKRLVDNYFNFIFALAYSLKYNAKLEIPIYKWDVGTRPTYWDTLFKKLFVLLK